MDPAGPQIYSLTATEPTLHPGGTTTFTALVTVLEGAPDILIGELRDDTGQLLGIFSRIAGDTFALSVTWALLDAVQSINAPPGGTTRSFTAHFDDTANHSGTASLNLQLACEAAAEAVCQGVCVDLQTSAQHCGACNAPATGGHVCSDGELTCTGGRTSCDGGM